MEMKINGETVNKALEAIANVSKTTANLTEGDKKQKKEKQSYSNRGGDTNNQQHQQMVEVHVGEAKEQPKPVVIHEKPETHIHKHFPDNRALTKDECDLEELRIKYQFEEEERKRAFQREQEQIERAERKERETYERQERIKREEERRKARKIRNVVAGAIGAALLGYIGYSFYSDSRSGAHHRLNLGAGEPVTSIPAEGNVE